MNFNGLPHNTHTHTHVQTQLEMLQHQIDTLEAEAQTQKRDHLKQVQALPGREKGGEEQWAAFVCVCVFVCLWCVLV